MATIRIHSRLRHLRLLNRITWVSADGIGAIADLADRPVFCGLEAMAQLAAMHVRQGIGFRRHAFLLKVTSGRWPREDVLKECCGLVAERYSRSSHGSAYRVRSLGPGDAVLCADLLIGTRPYDHQFREDILEAHYRNIFDRLRQG